MALVRVAVAGALIQPLAWELPYTAGVALKEKKKRFKKKDVLSKYQIVTKYRIRVNVISISIVYLAAPGSTGQSSWSFTPDTAVQSSWPLVPQQGGGKGYLLF